MNNQSRIIFLLLIAYLFSPSLFSWMADPAGSWLRPYLVWSLVIVTAFIIQRRTLKHQSNDGQQHDP